MLVNEITQGLLEKQVWSKSGKKIVRKYRCASGKRKGRVVSKAAQCYAPINIKQRQELKKTRAKMGKKMARKAKKTRKIDPLSKRISVLNRSASK